MTDYSEYETPVTSSTGGVKNRKLARYDLIPAGPLRRLAEQYGRGAEKYGDRNWEKGYQWSLSYAACQRHLNKFWAGQDWDEEFPDAHHLDAAMFHLMAMREFVDRHPGFDDRPHHTTPTPPEPAGTEITVCTKNGTVVYSGTPDTLQIVANNNYFEIGNKTENGLVNDLYPWHDVLSVECIDRNA